ncbi:MULTISPECIES: mechanosensitive ion channel family protein [unclassified Legionella]|uniref:mechanosensitive ion channel family protein n=1 Tax=unclassified Legionella TaxID=2622702 RepID=UPI001054818E|nr:MULTISPECIES: mechanosensitive ion channel family protein [unclassified Legionella]MDI9818366.1 mechanosensitive ion channel family protein [Legionella sp. PL877]
MTKLITFTQEHFWIIRIFSVVFITALLHMIAAKIINKLIVKAERTKIIYDDALLKAIKAPLAFLIWLVGISAAASLVAAYNPDLFFTGYIPQLKKFGFIIAISWGLIRFIHNIEILYIRACVQNSKEVDKTLVHALSQLVTISVIITSILVSMQIFGLPISGLLAFGGLGGAAIAFASKDLLANFFGSLVIYLDRPFKVGDWIRSPDKAIEGTVEFIGWRVTCIRTFDRSPLYVPNGVFLNISVENPSRMTNRRIKTTVGVRYQDADKIESLTADIRQMLMNHPEIDNQQTIIVNLVEFGSSSLNFMVYAFTKTTNRIKFQAVQHDVFMKILQIINSNGAECAFPTQTLFLQSQSVKEAIES